MRILRLTVLGIAGIAAVAFLTARSVNGQTRGGTGMMDSMPMAGKMMTKDQKIANAMTAAPAAVSAKAAILDWPAKEGMAPAVLRPGTNGWTCLPDMPDSQGNDPMCVDASWMAPGGAWGSNSDPYAMAKTSDNHWGLHPPHVMILAPDLKSLQGVSTDPNNGGPYVMFAGTPYAHVMAPIAGGQMVGMGTMTGK